MSDCKNINCGGYASSVGEYCSSECKHESRIADLEAQRAEALDTVARLSEVNDELHRQIEQLRADHIVDANKKVGDKTPQNNDKVCDFCNGTSYHKMSCERPKEQS